MMTDMFLQIDNSKAGKYAFALTGRMSPTHFIPRVSLRLPWAMRSLGFQPVSSKNDMRRWNKKHLTTRSMRSLGFQPATTP